MGREFAQKEVCTQHLTIVRFLALVTTMVTKVDHGNHRSNDHGNHRGYYNGNSFFLQEYLYLFR